MNDYIKDSFQEIIKICEQIDLGKVDTFVKNLVELRRRHGRLFILGYGGSAANADHMANDLMKICNIHCVVPTNYIALMTAVANDEDFQDYFHKFLKWNHASQNDDIFILSVSGHKEFTIQSSGLINALQFPIREFNKAYGIVGNQCGTITKLKYFDALLVPEVNPDMITPHSESMQAVIWHIVVNDPRLVKPTPYYSQNLRRFI